VLARLPDVQLGLDQQQRHRQTITTDRLRQTDQIGHDAGALEREERARATAADLDVVDDHQHSVAIAQIADSTQPFDGRHVDAAFGLDRFQNQRRRQIETRVRVVEQRVDVAKRVGEAIRPFGIRKRERVRQWRTCRRTILAVAGHGQAASSHAMPTAGECSDRHALGGEPSQLQCCFHRVGTGRAAELHAVVELARRQDDLAEPL
jgi:hypothetical protein